MDYRFGPNKPNFTGTDEEWEELKQKIAWWNKETSNYPSVTVICPHCGAKNTHTLDGEDSSHRECHLMLDKKGKKMYYDCPGYHICHYISAPILGIENCSMESNSRIKELGKYQYEWLNKYNSIDLDQWRLMFIHKINKPEWIYVGEWKPDIVEPYPSKKDGGYKQRQSNLEKNVYYYWPQN